jgi:hypothetical protein
LGIYQQESVILNAAPLPAIYPIEYCGTTNLRERRADVDGAFNSSVCDLPNGFRAARACTGTLSGCGELYTRTDTELSVRTSSFGKSQISEDRVCASQR